MRSGGWNERMHEHCGLTAAARGAGRRKERERGNKGHDKSHESRLRSFEEGAQREERRRDGEGEALLPIVVRTDINVGKKAREEG